MSSREHGSEMPGNLAEVFRLAMADAGLKTSDPIIADGNLRRFHVDGDRKRTRNGWYVLYPDAPACGVFGSHRGVPRQVWRPDRWNSLTAAEQAEFRRRTNEASAARERERSHQHQQARIRAGKVWGASALAQSDHPYLVRKRILPGIARHDGDRLVLPVVNMETMLCSLQFIDPNGEKRLLWGGKKQGNVIPVAGEILRASRILIAEGWATGMTLAAMCPTAFVLAAIDAGNLEPAAIAVRRRWPRMPIVICCDADAVGMAKGRAAAIASGAGIAVPQFPTGVAGTDFNDLVNALRAPGS